MQAISLIVHSARLAHINKTIDIKDIIKAPGVLNKMRGPLAKLPLYGLDDSATIKPGSKQL